MLSMIKYNYKIIRRKRFNLEDRKIQKFYQLLSWLTKWRKCDENNVLDITKFDNREFRNPYKHLVVISIIVGKTILHNMKMKSSDVTYQS